MKEEKAKNTPVKQRLTAARIERLLEAEGLVRSESTVRRTVACVRRELSDPLEHAYLPLSYEPGKDAQVDFCEGWADAPEGRVKVFLLLVRACFSAATFVYAAPNLRRESLLEGLMRAFEYFGGVFARVWFDNLPPAVRKVLKGRTRELQRRFESFATHQGFEPVFCAPGNGNEKGGVENQVKYCEHEILSPIPQIKDRDDVQGLSAAFMARNALRRPRSREETIGELWEREVPHLMPLPSSRFDAGELSTGKVSNRSWVSLGTNFYSVPVELVGERVAIKTTAEDVHIYHDRSGLVAVHRRLHGRDRMSLELAHYLPLLRRKIRGLDWAVPVRSWLAKASACWPILLADLRRLEGETDGSRSFVDVLSLCTVHGEEVVTQAVERALATDRVSLAAVRYHLATDHERNTPPPQPFEYAGPSVISTSSSAYRVLCAEGQEVAHG